MFWEVGVVTMVLAVALSAGDTPQGYGMDHATGALINTTDALAGFGAARGFTNDTELARMHEEAIDVNNGNSLDKHRPCFPIISCTLAGGHCVERRKDCDGTVDHWGCRGHKKCKCCIPDKTTPTPSTCPTVTPCPSYTTPTTTGPTVHPNTTWLNVGEDWFVRFPQMMNWFDAQALCQSYWLELYHPINSTAVAAYLEANFSEQWYWLGAKGNSTNQVWLDGEVLTYVDPWYSPVENNPWVYFNNGTNDCLFVITWAGKPALGTVLVAQSNGCTGRTNIAVLCG